MCACANCSLLCFWFIMLGKQTRMKRRRERVPVKGKGRDVLKIICSLFTTFHNFSHCRFFFMLLVFDFGSVCMWWKSDTAIVESAEDDLQFKVFWRRDFSILNRKREMQQCKWDDHCILIILVYILLQATRTTKQVIVSCSFARSFAYLRLCFSCNSFFRSVYTWRHVCTQQNQNTLNTPQKSISACNMLRCAKSSGAMDKRFRRQDKSHVTKKSSFSVSLEVFWLFYLLFFVVVMYTYIRRKKEEEEVFCKNYLHLSCSCWVMWNNRRNKGNEDVYIVQKNTYTNIFALIENINKNNEKNFEWTHLLTFWIRERLDLKCNTQRSERAD